MSVVVISNLTIILPQNLITESREIQEIKLLFKDIINKKLRLPFYLPLDEGLTLPAYFTNL